LTNDLESPTPEEVICKKVENEKLIFNCLVQETDQLCKLCAKGSYLEKDKK